MHGHHESFWTKYIFSQDHKVIAIQYTITALLVGIFGLVLSWLMRLQLGFPGEFQFLNPSSYYQMLTQHGMIMIVYLLTAILLGGFGNYLIPLMIGARDMAFPFLNMLSYWVYLLSVIVLMAAFVVPGGPTGAGWTLYPPLSALPNAAPGSGWGIKLMLVSLVIFIAAATMGGLNYVTTVLQCRTQGMTLMRMPLSVWGIFIASIIALLAFPALFVGGVMLLLDNLLGTSFFIPTVTLFGQQLPREGGNPLLFQHLFWYFGHPEVYVVILPAMGIASDLIATHSRKPIFGYKAMVIAMAAIAIIGFLVWAHHMFVSGMNPYFGFWFAAATVVIAIPSAVKVYNWLLTLWRGNIRFNTPMLFGIGWISTFIIGGLTGLPLGNVIADVPLHDTYFVVGHFHLVMGVAALMAIFGGIYHWFPKVTGRMFNETLGKLHFWVTFVGAYMIFFPMFLLGILGVPRRYFDFTVLQYLPPQTSGLNTIITIAALIVGAVQLIFLANLIGSAVRGRRAAPNPWQATTLEWQTPTTPPPHGNWGAETPTVYRWAYDYSVPGAERDFIPQNVPTTPTVPVGAGSTVR
ncbi:MAG: cbb3-type cytochrome c oxidase subunit I [Candidatus Bipolaricaulota bacterium]|nr:cbb3-type cytochrome c oxidase subunit I [Candidatus Bipolaricaulota bacterium]